MTETIHLLDLERYLVFGAARSGLAAARLLKQRGKDVCVYDQCEGERRERVAARLSELDVPFIDDLADVSFPEKIDAMILSPGIPTTHSAVRQAMDGGVRVCSEIELAACAAKAPVIAITGTNGKTTTTHLIDHVLRVSGRPSVMGGNVGRALCDAVLEPQADDPAAEIVCEVSSFQLETIEAFRPRVAIVLNITPDHLDRYGDMDSYMEAKRRITMNQESSDALVLNAEDKYCLSFINATRAEVLRFSVHSSQPRGAWLHEGTLLMRLHEGEDAQAVMKRSEIQLVGLHNVENILAAICALGWVGLTCDEIANGIRSFTAVPHRIELVGERGGVKFYNDSKATNLDSVEKALESFPKTPVVLIAGGRDKGAPWERLRNLVHHRVKALVLIGEASEKIETAWGHDVTVHRAADMADAVRAGAELAGEGDAVLLSPGCASFDMYENFEKRGEDFRRCVKELTGN